MEDVVVMWDMAWIADPSAWAGLGTLIVLEVVLGIDNLVFISVLASRLPEAQKRQAFFTGLGLALVIRLGLLCAVAWIVGLTEPLFSVWGRNFSWRDVILLLGGVFLLFKGTMELHERLEGGVMGGGGEDGSKAVFWQVIAQILVLDAIFSLDSIITSVGMVPHVPVMMIAVVVAMVVMVAAAGPLTAFVERHPTVIILCLGFLLMIGVSLVTDGMGFHIPKGYLYAAIAFSIFVEGANQLALRNRRKRISMRDMRESTARAVLGLLGGGRAVEEARRDAQALAADEHEEIFAPEECDIVARVIRLSGRAARFIMKPRHRVRWLDADASREEALRFVAAHPSAAVPVLDRHTDEVLGVVPVALLAESSAETGPEGEPWSLRSLVRSAPTVFEEASLPDVLEMFRKDPTPLAFVRDEYGGVVGVLSPAELLSVLAGQMGDMPSGPEACRQADGSWIMPGRLAVDAAASWLGVSLPPRSCSATLAGLLLELMDRIPSEGDSVVWRGWRFEVRRMDGRRIDEVRVTRE
ncbi:transporter associated domain-containing protein [uncultured Desulfovibrio sp.]|uniref:TerC family protein n=1 Tax=uncultured Desulfovibrio sp. TaxID=167968 RepID=UPI00262B48F5|nr:transporter associated domain-containing protein [uncultured Desulfovibrio sp.]